MLLADGADRLGVDWTAVVQDRAQERLNTAAAIRHFGRTTLEPFMQKIEFQAVCLKPRRRG